MIVKKIKPTHFYNDKNGEKLKKKLNGCRAIN